ncbi:ankyrin repeat domain-containing protein [Cohnella sp. 56]|uniref:ankyrin repeat domain-containing protein n=1 Tax=Cohnella sp. 56 TaxID=3113722 RepID=UPI0030E9AF27
MSICLRPGRFALIAAAALLIAALPISTPLQSIAPAHAAATAPAAKQQLTLQLQTIRLNRVIMVPARAFFQSVGARSQFQNKSFTATLESRSLSGTTNSTKAFIDGKAVKLAYAPTVVKGILYIPLELAGGLLEYDAWRYDDETRKLTFSYSKQKMNEFAASLHKAAKQGDVKLLRKLLDSGVETNAKVNGYADWTALDYAILNHRPQAADLLLERGGTYKPMLIWPLLHPSDMQATDTLEALLKRGLEPNLWDIYTRTTLLEQASMRSSESRPDGTEVTRVPSYETIRLLLQYGAKVTPDALYHAVGSGSFEIIQELLRYGGDPDQKSSNGTTPRAVAQSRGVEEWLVRGASQTLVPLAFRTAEGTALEEGSAQLRPLAGTGPLPGGAPLPVSVSFNTTQVYIEAGSYQPEFVMVYGKGWVLHRQPAIDIQNGASGSVTLQLPKLNAKVRVLAGDPAQWYGILYIIDAVSGQIYLFHPAQGVFELYLPPGKFYIDIVQGEGEIKPSASAVPIEIREDQPYYEIAIPTTEG